MHPPLPMRDCNVTMNLFYLFCDRLLARKPNFYDCASRQASGCCRCCRASARRPPLCGWWPWHPDEGVWSCSGFRAGERVKSGYPGWWILFCALVDLKEAIKASRKRVNKEVVANILNVNPKVFPLHSEEDIVEQFLTQ